MRKVAVFGNAGGGKSTLARGLAEVTGLPLYQAVASKRVHHLKSATEMRAFLQAVQQEQQRV
jgi:adenylate kinase family enzyme